MPARSPAFVHVLRSGSGGRSHTVHSGHYLVCLLCGFVRNNDRRGHSTPGGSTASGCARRVPAGVLAFRTLVSNREHPRGITLGLKHRVGSVLHRDRAGRTLAGRWLACDLVQSVAHRVHWSHLLLAGMAHHATHAGERVTNEKVVPSIHELSNSFF